MPKSTPAAPQSFVLPLKKTWSVLCLPLTPTASRPIDAAWYSFTFISAAYEPDMIYAVPLTSLSPSSVLSACTPFFLTPLLLLLFVPPCTPPPCSPLLSSPLSPLCRALCPMGIRVAQQTTSATARRGKLMRRSSWRTMWGTFISPLNVWVTEVSPQLCQSLSRKTSGVHPVESCSLYNWNIQPICLHRCITVEKWIY